MKTATTTMKKSKSGSKERKGGNSPAQLIDARIKELRDWRGETLARVRILIKQADPEVIEEWKWRGVPVWSHAGIICTGETYKNVVKLTFAKGAALEDPSGLFNSSLEGNTRRAIDIHEGDKIDEKALQALVRAAVARNTSQPPSESGKRPSAAGRAFVHLHAARMGALPSRRLYRGSALQTKCGKKIGDVCAVNNGSRAHCGEALEHKTDRDCVFSALEGHERRA